MSATAAVGRTNARRRARRIGSFIVTSAWLVTCLAVAVAIGVALFFYRGDAEGSSRIANREIESLLGRGEVVAQRVPVMQRHWWDYYRVTHGVLAATDRRLLYVGVPPAPLLPREEEPQSLTVQSFPFEVATSVRFQRVFLGTRPGLQLTGGMAHETFAFRSEERSRVDSVLAVLAERQAVLREAAEAERRATEAATAASRRPIYHLVQRGEALEVIARRYGVPVDTLMAWNNLPTARIAAGSRLLVKPGS